MGPSFSAASRRNSVTPLSQPKIAEERPRLGRIRRERVKRSAIKYVSLGKRGPVSGVFVGARFRGRGSRQSIRGPRGTERDRPVRDGPGFCAPCTMVVIQIPAPRLVRFLFARSVLLRSYFVKEGSRRRFFPRDRGSRFRGNPATLGDPNHVAKALGRHGEFKILIL